MLSVLLVLLVLFNVIVALASSFAVILLGRALMGVAVGDFWTVDGSPCPRLQPASATKAGAVILLGFVSAQVVGAPAGALLGVRDCQRHFDDGSAPAPGCDVGASRRKWPAAARRAACKAIKIVNLNAA